MIAVDTSVWVAALRDRDCREAGRLDVLLEDDLVLLPAPVKIEILVGAARRDRSRLRRLLSALPVVYPNSATWQSIDRWIDAAAAAGDRFGFADLLIGALASENGAELWSLDSDFSRMARMGLVKDYQPFSTPGFGNGTGHGE